MVGVVAGIEEFYVLDMGLFVVEAEGEHFDFLFWVVAVKGDADGVACFVTVRQGVGFFCAVIAGVNLLADGVFHDDLLLLRRLVDGNFGFLS